MKDISIPDYLKETEDTIHKRMLEGAPKDINLVEGDIFWDSTRPTAIEKARLENVQLQNILRMAFPQSSTGEYLEYLGEFKCVYKNKPTYSTGEIKVIAKPNTPIRKGVIVSTEATETAQSIEFELIETIIIDDTGERYIRAKCLTPGTIGNVEPNTITILQKSIDGVKSINNESKFTGGTDIEDEEHFRERVMNAEKEESLSGADSDYIKWAKEVDGVGNAYVIEEWNGPGTVKILILDKNGQAATEELISKVKEYIYPDKKEGENRGGKAPVGAIVTISTPTTLTINIKADFSFTEGFSPELVINTIKEKISSYFNKIKINGTVKYKAIDTIIGSYVLEGEGIDDYTNLTINDVDTNIRLIDQVPIIGEVINNDGI